MATRSPQRYTRTAVSLHWLVALLVFTGWGIGVTMTDLPVSPERAQYYSWHKWIGVTVFLLAVLRAAWRATHAPPALPAGLRAWEVLASRLTHGLFYLLLFALPLSGWLMSSAKGYQTVYLGVLPIPDLLGKDKALAEALEDLHGALAWTLATLVGLHVAAVIKHHALDKVDILGRMLPALLAALLLGAASAGAVLPDKSRITATFRQMNVPVEAEFTGFRGAVALDPDNLSTASAQLEVDTASLDLGDEEYSAELRKPAWFDSGQYPRATFTSSKVRRGERGFIADGTLTIKGQARPQQVTFALVRTPASFTYAGQFALSRKDFGIGDAAWDEVLEDEVVVRFRITTQRS